MILRVCPGNGDHRCGQLIPRNQKRCQPCTITNAQARAAVEQRRRTRQHQHGRNSQHWKRLRAAAIEAYPHCAHCLATTHLTVHLKPTADCYPHHDQATLADVLVLCASCHGKLDAPRSSHDTRTPVGGRATIENHLREPDSPAPSLRGM